MRVLRGKLKVATVLTVALLCFTTSRAIAQTIVIENAHLLIGDGRSLEKGSVLISGDSIGGVGRRVNARGGLFSRPKKIDASGKYVTPGLIDVWSSPVLNPPTVGQPHGRAADAVDRFDEDWMDAAHRGGVTTLYVPARSQGGFGGLGAVVRLLPGGSAEDMFVDDRAALCAAVGGSGGVQRSKNYSGLHTAFREANDHREALENYEEDLEEYEKELKEWIEKREKEKSEGDDKKKDGDKDKPEKDEAEASDGKAAGLATDEPRPRRRRRGGPAGGPQKPAPEKDGEDNKKDGDDGPEKPNKPARAPGKDVLLEALDGELIWRVEANRVADISNVLDVAKEYGLALVIEGATGAPWVAEKLAEQEVPVVLGAGGTLVRGGSRDAHGDALATLHEAGVEMYFGSGPSAATGQLALRAAQAVAAGVEERTALKRLWHDAAVLLGVSDRVGRLEPGLSADVVIWSDHPFAPGARVERVFVGGKEVYVAE